MSTAREFASTSTCLSITTDVGSSIIDRCPWALVICGQACGCRKLHHGFISETVRYGRRKIPKTHNGLAAPGWPGFRASTCLARPHMARDGGHGRPQPRAQAIWDLPLAKDAGDRSRASGVRH